MSSYKYFVDEKNGKYLFGLYPNNRNSESIGVSGLYDSRQEAINAIRIFQSYIFHSDNATELFEVICVNDNSVEKFTFKLKDNIYQIKFERELLYWNKYEAQNGVKRTIKNADAPVKSR